MKATLLTVSALALLAGGAGTGYMAAHNDNEQILKHQIAGQKQMVSQMKKLEHTMLKIQIETLEAEVWEKDDVSESFIITEVANGSVRGKLSEGNGEGIFYPKGVFIDHGFGDIKVGDEYTITWSGDAYDNEDWHIIKEIGKTVGE
jgi:hypothetical protein